jgi:hypothetical protein
MLSPRERCSVPFGRVADLSSSCDAAFAYRPWAVRWSVRKFQDGVHCRTRRKKMCASSRLASGSSRTRNIESSIRFSTPLAQLIDRCGCGSEPVGSVRYAT